MRWRGYHNQIGRSRRRRPIKNDEETEKVFYDDKVTNENEDYEIIEDVKYFKNNYEEKKNENEYKHFKSFDNNYNNDDNPHGFNIESEEENNNWHMRPQGWNGKSFYNKNNWHKKSNYQKPNYNWHPASGKNQSLNDWHKPSNQEPIENSQEDDLVSTIKKLFNGDNDMVKEIISTLQDTGILENFREPLSMISRVYGPLLDGNNNQQYGRPPMRAYNNVNRRIKHMQMQDANKQLHSEMYSIILKQVKDMLVKNYGTKIKDNMPSLFDDE